MSLSLKLRVGVIGAGRIGAIHAENLAGRVPGAELSAIADINLASAQRLAARLNVPATAEYQAVMGDAAIEAVIICSSTETHARMIEEAAAAGKHIFCEKPIDFDLGRTDRALAAVERAGVKLQIGFNRRFDSNFRKVQEVVAAGKIGAPHLLRITSRDPAPPPAEYIKVSGGLFLDMAIHDFDMARYLMGSEVTEVFASGAVLVDPAIGQLGDVDTAVTVLRFANGAIGAIDNSRQAVYGYDQRAEVFGSGGVVAVSNNAADSAVISDAQGVHAGKPLHFFLERYAESYAAEMKAFVNAVQQDLTPPVTGAAGRAAMVIGLAAKKSLAEHRPVTVAEIG